MKHPYVCIRHRRKTTAQVTTPTPPTTLNNISINNTDRTPGWFGQLFLLFGILLDCTGGGIKAGAPGDRAQARLGVADAGRPGLLSACPSVAGVSQLKESALDTMHFAYRMYGSTTS